jgi:hypothetical protein
VKPNRKQKATSIYPDLIILKVYSLYQNLTIKVSEEIVVVKWKTESIKQLFIEPKEHSFLGICFVNDYIFSPIKDKKEEEK